MALPCLPWLGVVLLRWQGGLMDDELWMGCLVDWDVEDDFSLPDMTVQLALR